jgi:hypothetical protein
MSVDRCLPQVSAVKVHGHIHLRPQNDVSRGVVVARLLSPPSSLAHTSFL